MSQSYALLESILWQRGKGYWMLDRHLSRLKASCEALGFKYDPFNVTEALDQCVRDITGEHLKTRFELFESGGIKYSSQEITPISDDTIWNVAIAPQRLNKADKLIYHKTTKRDLYSEAHQWGKTTHGADEVILLNGDGEICEGSFCNVFVKVDGVLLTPPVSNGLLAGTFRSKLLGDERAVEQEILVEMLSEFPIFMGNSVRGLIRAQLIG